MSPAVRPQRARIVLLTLALVTAALGAAADAAPSASDTPSGIPLCHGGGPPRASARALSAPGRVQGLGDAGFAAEGVSPKATSWFLDGWRLNNAFNEPEALRAFRYAEAVDPACALCAWGEADALGPTINYPTDLDGARRARAALARARAHSSALSPLAQGLIRAQEARWPDRRTAPFTDDRAYARAMDTLAGRFPADDAVLTQAANAWMILQSRNVGAFRPPAPGSPFARAEILLEQVLARSPNFTPAIHFYIHLMEWTGRPGRAIPAAERLASLAPAAGHLVHMPSHVFFRVGRFEDAVLANVRAANADRAYVAAVSPPGGIGDFALHAHNLSFGLSGALMSGDSRAALDLAHRLEADLPLGSPARARAWLAYADDLEPSSVLLLPDPPAAFAYERALRRYARGEAYARLGQAAGVRQEADALGSILRGSGWTGLDKRSPGRDLAEVGRLILIGRASSLERRWPDAVKAYRRAADLRDAKDGGMDPPTWGRPPRVSLAAALLKAGDPGKAHREIDRSLARFPNDPGALAVLADLEAQLGRSREAGSWSRSNNPTPITAPLLKPQR